MTSQVSSAAKFKSSSAFLNEGRRRVALGIRNEGREGEGEGREGDMRGREGKDVEMMTGYDPARGQSREEGGSR